MKADKSHKCMDFMVREEMEIKIHIHIDYDFH